MKAVKVILRAFGVESVDDMDLNERYEVEGPGSGMMDLVIEKVYEDRLSVAHYYTQRGDLMSDPEIVFDTSEDEWVPVRFTQHPAAHEHDEDGLEMKEFLNTWNKNIQTQGYVNKVWDEEDDAPLEDV